MRKRTQPVLGNGLVSVKRPGELAGDCGHRVSITAEVRSEKHCFFEATGPGNAPNRRFEAVRDIT